jgi:hypothetical protein
MFHCSELEQFKLKSLASTICNSDEINFFWKSSLLKIYVGFYSTEPSERQNIVISKTLVA